MAIKNGRYKDKNGAVRHFETNENMVIVDDGQKTLKQKLSSLVESLSDLLKKFTAHETSKTAHVDIRGLIGEKADKSYVDRLSYVVGNKHFSSNDANDWNVTGVYGTNEETLNRPPNASWGVVTVQGASENLIQFYTPMNNNGNNNNRRGFLWARSKDNVGWSDWKQIATTDGEIQRLANNSIIQDFDTFTALNEIHRVDVNGGTTNFPDGADTFGAVINIGNASNTFQQVYYCSDGEVFTRGYRGWESPQWRVWRKVSYEDKTFINRNLNETNIDTQRGNYVAGVSVAENTGTVPFSGWNNIMQFDSKHFVTQLGVSTHASVSASSNGLAMRSRWASSEWGEWKYVALTNKAEVSLLNGWESTGNGASLTKIGSRVFCKVDMKNGAFTGSTILFSIPEGYRPKLAVNMLLPCIYDGASGVEFRNAVLEVSQIRIPTSGWTTIATGRTITIDYSWEVA